MEGRGMAAEQEREAGRAIVVLMVGSISISSYPHS